MRLRQLLRENGLSLVLAAAFCASLLGQVGFGLAAYNSERLERGLAAIEWSAARLAPIESRSGGPL